MMTGTRVLCLLNLLSLLCGEWGLIHNENPLGTWHNIVIYGKVSSQIVDVEEDPKT